jgi:hypothetical protein
VSKKKQLKKQARKDELARKRQTNLAFDWELRGDFERQREAFWKKVERDDPLPSARVVSPLSEEAHDAITTDAPSSKRRS